MRTVAAAAMLFAAIGAAPPSQVIAGVDLDQPFRASGAGPAWLFENTGKGFRFNNFLSNNRKPVAVTLTTGIAIGRGHAFIRGRTARGEPVVLVLIATPCPDLGEETRRLTARLSVGTQGYTGCADASSEYQ